MITIWSILASIHIKNGEGCSCGEPVDDCFYWLVLLPAHEKTMEDTYANLFGEG